MYTTEDIFQLIIQIEERAADCYATFSQKEDLERSLKTMSMVLAAEERRHRKQYREMKETHEHQEVPVDLYHKASQLLAQFKPSTQAIPLSISGFLAFAADLESENLALAIRLRDLFRELERSSDLLEKLDRIVSEEEAHVEQLSKIISKRGDDR